MRIGRIGHVVLRVRDLAQAEAFYTEALGFEVASRLERPKSVFLTLGEQHHDIALFETAADSGPAVRDGAGLDHIGLRLESFEALREAYRDLKQRGVAIERAVDHGTTNSFYFSDPAGNRLELYCDVGTDGLARARRRTERTVDEFAPLGIDGGDGASDIR